MLISLPFLLLFLSSAFGAILQIKKIRLAYTWIFLTIMALLVWILVLFMPYNTLKPLILENWFSINNNLINLSFVIDHLNWPVIFMIITLDLFFLLSSVVTANEKQDFFHWIASQIIIAFIILALTADNLWTVVICWTAYDIAVIMIKAFPNSQSLNIFDFKPYFIRFFGSIFLIWIIAYSGFNESIAELGRISADLHLGLFFAALFHAGALGSKLIEKETQKLLNLNHITHIGSIVISVSILFRIPAPTLVPLTSLVIEIILSLVSIYSGLSCLLAQNDQKRLDYLIMTFLSSISLAFFIGNINAGIFWLAFFVISLGVMRLSNFKNNYILILFFLYYILSSGLPFTYLAFGSRGMLASEFSLFAFLTILPHALILAELFRTRTLSKEEFIETDPRRQAVYYLGMFLPILALTAISLKYISDIEAEFEYWWAGLSVVLISALIAVYVIRSASKDSSIIKKEIEPLDNKDMAWNWVANTGRLFYSLLGQTVLAISNLLEGRGGMLWAIVILALLLTILRL